GRLTTLSPRAVADRTWSSPAAVTMKSSSVATPFRAATVRAPVAVAPTPSATITSSLTDVARSPSALTNSMVSAIGWPATAPAGCSENRKLTDDPEVASLQPNASAARTIAAFTESRYLLIDG